MPTNPDTPYIVDPDSGKVYRPVGCVHTRWGYVIVSAAGKFHRAHRMVWEAVVGPIPDGLTINHKNGIKTDNRISNLEPMTIGDNARHAYTIGRGPDRTNRSESLRGEGNYKARLTSDTVREMRHRYSAGGVSYAALGREYGVTGSNARKAITGRSWAHVD